MGKTGRREWVLSSSVVLVGVWQWTQNWEVWFRHVKLVMSNSRIKMEIRGNCKGNNWDFFFFLIQNCV